MKSASNRSMLWCSLLALALVPLFAAAAAAQDENLTPREEGAALEDNLLYGHSVTDGSLLLAAENLATFCPDPAILVVHPDHVDVAREQLKAELVDDETWAVPDPETGEVVTAKVQYATGVYDDGTATAASLETEKLPVLSSRAVSIVPILWPRCWTLRWNHICGTLGSCGPAGCQPGGFTWTTLRNHLVCRRQPGSLCLQFLAPVCRLNRFFCSDCTGPITGIWIFNRWVCAVF
jgi:hypothetical protein